MSALSYIALILLFYVVVVIVRDRKRLAASINLPKAIFVLIVLAVIIWVFTVFRLVLSYVVYAVLLSLLVKPIVKMGESLGIKRVGAIFISYLLIVLLFAFAANFLIPYLAEQTAGFQPVVTNINETVNLITSTKDINQIAHMTVFKNNPKALNFVQTNAEWINKHIIRSGNFDSVMEKLSGEFSQWMVSVPQQLVGMLSSLFGFLSYLLMVPIIAFFILKDSDRMKKQALEAVPNRWFELVVLIKEKFGDIVGGYIRALMIQVAIISSLASIALTIAGVPNSLLIGLLAGFANMIPYFGPLIGISFALLSILLTGAPLVTIGYMIIGMLCVQALDNIIVYPMVMGKNVDMHPLVVTLAVLSGGFAFGIVGMLLAVPVFSLLSGMIKLLYINLKGFEII